MSNLLHLKVVGKGSPLVLLHGWGWHSAIWSPLIPHLADKFELFMPDLPGFGKNPILTSTYNLENIATLLLNEIPEEAIWLGWSLGGLIAWWIAAHYPERVTRLITVASSPKFISDENWPGIPAAVLEKFSLELQNNYQITLYDFLSLQLRGSPKNKALFTELKTQLSPADSRALIGGLQLLKETDLRFNLQQIKIPSLHIFGSLDTIVPVKVTEHLKPLLFNGQCEIIKHAGHIPFLSNMKDFLNLLNNSLI